MGPIHLFGQPISRFTNIIINQHTKDKRSSYEILMKYFHWKRFPLKPVMVLKYEKWSFCNFEIVSELSFREQKVMDLSKEQHLYKCLAITDFEPSSLYSEIITVEWNSVSLSFCFSLSFCLSDFTTFHLRCFVLSFLDTVSQVLK